MKIIDNPYKSFIKNFPNFDKKTLVVFDIDYTLLRSSTLLGTPEWLYHLLKQELLNCNNYEASFIKWYPIWMKAQKYNEIVLMDQDIHSLLDKIKEEAFGFIMLTARHPLTEELTFQQLKKLNIKFEESSPLNMDFYSKFEYPTLYKKNILFSNDLNKKNLIFGEWIQQVIKVGERHNPIQKIIFVDDMIENVISMSYTITKLGLDYEGIHYSASDIYKNSFEPRLAEHQAAILMHEHSDAKIRKLLKKKINF